MEKSYEYWNVFGGLDKRQARRLRRRLGKRGSPMIYDLPGARSFAWTGMSSVSKKKTNTSSNS